MLKLLVAALAQAVGSAFARFDYAIEIIELKRVERFISYDTYTAYSRFASLCGCDSIVIPDEGVTLDQWYANPQDRYGVSYGFDGIEEARATRSKMRERILAQEEKSLNTVRVFISETQNLFAKA